MGSNEPGKQGEAGGGLGEKHYEDEAEAERLKTGDEEDEAADADADADADNQEDSIGPVVGLYTCHVLNVDAV